MMPDDREAEASSLREQLEESYDEIFNAKPDEPAADPAGQEASTDSDQPAEPEPDKAKAKEEPAAEKSLRDEIEDTYDKIFDERTPDEKAAAESSDAWSREQRRLADQALEAAGIDPAERHQRGLSRRQITRNLYAAEQQLRTDPAAGLAQIAQTYVGNLDQTGKLRAAASILGALGLPHAGQIAEHDRQRLQQYEQSEQQRAAAIEQARPQVEQEVRDFAASRPDFQQLRSLMGALVSSGQARDLATAYDMARRASGLPDRAQAADQARRDKLARVKAASTPRSRSTNAQATVDHSDKEIRQLIEESYDEIFGRE